MLDQFEQRGLFPLPWVGNRSVLSVYAVIVGLANGPLRNGLLIEKLETEYVHVQAE